MTTTTTTNIQKELQKLAAFKGLNGKVYPYLIESIDFEGYDLKQAETMQELLQQLYDTFYNGKIKHFANWRAYYKHSLHAAFIDWLQGLPSSYNIDFEYCKIIEIGYKWEQINPNLTAKQKDKRERNTCAKIGTILSLQKPFNYLVSTK